MTLIAALLELERMGTAQNRKIYARHGAGTLMYGVSTANLKKLGKKIGTDHSLALDLWSTRNMDAQTLATMIADPAAVTAAQLEEWIAGVQYYMLAGYVAGLAHRSPHAARLRKRWSASGKEFIAQAGWDLIGLAAIHAPESVPAEDWHNHIATIEKKIHKAPNRARHAMNGALIAIALINDKLKKAAIAAAKRIGKVEVDHGETSCETPDAAAYIEKAAARKAQRSKPR